MDKRSMNRTLQPTVYSLEQIDIQRPVEERMPNGVPLNIIHCGKQEVVRLDIVFEGGRWQQERKLQALFTNRMLREGSCTYTSAEIANKLDYYGSWLELSTSMEHSFITLYSLNKYFKETLGIIESLIKEPLFPEKEFSTVVETNIQSFLINSSKVDYQAYRSLMMNVFGEDHPCGKMVSEQDYRTINTNSLRDFYERYYHSEGCRLFISGLVTDEILNEINRAFGRETFGKKNLFLADRKEYTIHTSPEKRFFTEKEDAMQSAIKMGCSTIARTHPDYLKYRVLITLFGGYFGSRLMSNIREEKGYTYGISAGTSFYPGTGLLLVSTEAANEYVEAVVSEVYHEIDLLQNELVSEQELSMVKNYMLGEMCRNYESAFSLSDAWIFIQTNKLENNYFSRSLQAVKEVTATDIRDLACRYLCKENLKEVIAGKKML